MEVISPHFEVYRSTYIFKAKTYKMLKLCNQVTHRGVFGGYTQVFYPMGVVSLHLKSTEQPNLHKLT